MNYYVNTYGRLTGSNYTGNKVKPYIDIISDNWDDYGYKTLFNLTLYDKQHPNGINLGAVKILFEEKDSSITRKVIPANFNKLNETFCSLGQIY